MSESRTLLHDLSNKLLIVSGKIVKAKKLNQNTEVLVELEKAEKNCQLSLELLRKLKEAFKD